MLQKSELSLNAAEFYDGFTQEIIGEHQFLWISSLINLGKTATQNFLDGNVSSYFLQAIKYFQNQRDFSYAI